MTKSALHPAPRLNPEDRNDGGQAKPAPCYVYALQIGTLVEMYLGEGEL